MDKWNIIPTKNGEFQCRASLLNERKMNLQSHIKFKVPSPPTRHMISFLNGVPIAKFSIECPI